MNYEHSSWADDEILKEYKENAEWKVGKKQNIISAHQILE